MAGRIVVSTELLPLVVVTLEGEASDAEYDGHLATMSDLLRAGQSRVAILDGRRSLMYTMSHVQRQAAWLREHRRELEALDFVTVLVMDRPMLRFALSTMLTIAPIPGTHFVVSTLTEAVSTARNALRQRSLQVPPGIDQLARADHPSLEASP